MTCKHSTWSVPNEHSLGFPDDSVVKNPPANAGDPRDVG